MWVIFVVRSATRPDKTATASSPDKAKLRKVNCNDIISVSTLVKQRIYSSLPLPQMYCDMHGLTAGVTPILVTAMDWLNYVITWLGCIALLNSASPIRRHRQREPKVVVGAPPARGTESPVFRVRGRTKCNASHGNASHAHYVIFLQVIHFKFN